MKAEGTASLRVPSQEGPEHRQGHEGDTRCLAGGRWEGEQVSGVSLGGCRSQTT